MNSPIRRQTPTKPPRVLMVAGLAAAMGLLQCETRLAGSSVGTGNPTEIEVAFADESGPISLSGRVEVYAATQITVPGFSPEPLIRLEVSGEGHATLDGEAFLSLDDSLWPMSSVEGDSAWLFNVVVTGNGRGAVIRGLRFAEKRGEFLLRPEDVAPLEGKAALVAGALKPLVEIRGRMDAGDLNPQMESFLFVYGTGFCARGESGRFVFPPMPSEEYDAFLISYWAKGSPFGGSDPLDVFRLDAKIGVESEARLSRNGIQETVPIPDSLKSK
jgi:hypothetical protein